jgi:predicted AAA+ superfamily ATPase
MRRLLVRYKTLSIRQLWDKTEEDPFKSNEYLDREVFAKLKKNLDSPKIDIIYGPRQSGKTTILMFLIDHLNNLGIDASHTWYINLDLISDYSLFESAEKFLYLYDKSQVEGKLYLFIDEIQRLSAPGLFLKGIYDSRRNIKVIISGSASFEIKAKIKEFLTGRKRLHLVLPLSFREIVKAKGVIPAGLYEQKINRDNIAEWIKADEVFQKYLLEELENTLVYGFYPGVYAASGMESKLEELNEIYNSYLKKDVFDYFKVERPEVFNNLVTVLGSQVGNLVNISELCSLLSSSRNTTEKYLGILRDTFIISLLPPFTSNKRSEIKYSSKIYFNDPGIMNWTQKKMFPPAGRPDIGSVMENMVFIEMQKNLGLLDDIYYWRTKSKAEVDFVYSGKDRITPIEVKTGSAAVGTLTRSFYSFIETHNPPRAIFLNKDKFAHFRINQTDVYYIPLHWFLLAGRDIID